MSTTPFKNTTSSSPEQGTTIATEKPAQHSPKSIEPPTDIAQFMVEHSDDEEDPMTMGRIGLGQDRWEDLNEENDEPAHSSPTPAKVSNAEEEFEMIDIPDSKDMAYIHEQHVRAMMHHRVPDYPIPPHHASPIGLDDGGREGQLRRYNLFIEECYPDFAGSTLLLKRAMEDDLQDAPRHGSPNRYLRITHIKGQTLEVHKEDWKPCDRTCPARKKTFLEKLTIASGKLFGMR
ncbi:hypothetical protein CBER1_03918 [Cercospora berteroae]|uniref:Uncharacterized protein n=1 Tax=Cercospora berteroae TaxID=357750 RepID=A0A2S6C9Z1_9PEZI|nr:hypothetical protein CBER1_03918 [Cercospora berteroae]